MRHDASFLMSSEEFITFNLLILEVFYNIFCSKSIYCTRGKVVVLTLSTIFENISMRLSIFPFAKYLCDQRKQNFLKIFTDLLLLVQTA